jgi:hypothetical protein
MKTLTESRPIGLAGAAKDRYGREFRPIGQRLLDRLGVEPEQPLTRTNVTKRPSSFRPPTPWRDWATTLRALLNTSGELAEFLVLPLRINPQHALPRRSDARADRRTGVASPSTCATAPRPCANQHPPSRVQSIFSQVCRSITRRISKRLDRLVPHRGCGLRSKSIKSADRAAVSTDR